MFMFVCWCSCLSCSFAHFLSPRTACLVHCGAPCLSAVWFQWQTHPGPAVRTGGHFRTDWARNDKEDTPSLTSMESPLLAKFRPIALSLSPHLVHHNPHKENLLLSGPPGSGPIDSPKWLPQASLRQEDVTEAEEGKTHTADPAKALSVRPGRFGSVPGLTSSGAGTQMYTPPPQARLLSEQKMRAQNGSD